MRIVKRLILPVIFLIISLIVVFSAYKIVLNQDQFEGLSEKQYQTNHKNDDSTSSNAEITNVDLKDYTSAKKKAQTMISSGAIGQIEIPKINISLPIFQYATNDTLSIGTAQYNPSLKMGQSNYVLVSHNFNGADVLLNRINFLKKADNIEITDGNKKYTYRVIVNKIIKETEISYLKPNKTSILTLIRCEGGENTPYRRLIIANLVKNVRSNDKPKNSRKQESSISQKNSFFDGIYQQFRLFSIFLISIINSPNVWYIAVLWLFILSTIIIICFKIL